MTDGLTYKPMNPVVYWAKMMVGRTSDESQEWLNEAETHGDEAKDGVGVGVDGLGQVPQLQQDQDEARHGEAPGQHHEVSVPDEPLIKIETSL